MTEMKNVMIVNTLKAQKMQRHNAQRLKNIRVNLAVCRGPISGTLNIGLVKGMKIVDGEPNLMVAKNL